MSTYSTNYLLDLCRNGIMLKNESTDTAANELASYIVFSSLMDDDTNVPDELEPRVLLLITAKNNPAEFLVNMVEDAIPDNGPLVA